MFPVVCASENQPVANVGPAIGLHICPVSKVPIGPFCEMPGTPIFEGCISNQAILMVSH
jgi:hypothetical protein